MNDDDDKSSGSDDRRRRGAAAGSSKEDFYPVRNTAPAGTPAHKFPATMPLGIPITPDQLGAPPVVKSTSDRPLPPSGQGPVTPPVDTISQARTVGGQTARLRVPTDEDMPRTRGRRGQAAARPREEIEEAPGSTRRGGPARGGKEGPSWEAEVKFSDPDIAKAPPAAATPAAAAPVDPLAESRWPFAIALGAVAFAIGSLLPLPFRKHIVASAPEAASVQPTIPLPAKSAPAPPQAPTAPGAQPAATTSNPASTAVVAPPGMTAIDPGSRSSATTAPAASAAPSGAASSGKRAPTGKGGKGGHIGDIF